MTPVKLTFTFMMLVTAGFLNGADVIKNPGKPLNKDSGKVLDLKEVMSIQDKEGEFYFRYPRNIKVSSDGSIFVFENKQLLKFNSWGKFCRNFYKHGQGPQEVTHISNYLLMDRRFRRGRNAGYPAPPAQIRT